MLAWCVIVFRQADGGKTPASTKSQDTGERIAIWQTGPYGLKWVRELVDNGKLIDLGGDGYPNLYTGRAEHLLPIANDPPDAHDVWLRDDFDRVTEDYVGKTRIDQKLIDDCRFDEWLIVHLWDES